MASSVSIVVVGRNEGPRLARCLDSIRAAEALSGPLPVTYVDSGSVDGSAELARKYGVEVICLKGPSYTAARARNAGWQASASDLVLFLDGDTVLDPGFLPIAVRQFDDPRIAAVSGLRREIATADSLFNRVCDYDWIRPSGVAEYCGGDALMRRSALEETGGYEDGLIAGEEPELCSRFRRRGYTILNLDCPMTGHDLAIHSWSQYARRAMRTGFAYAEISRRLQNTDTPLWVKESSRNRKQAVLYLLTPCVSIALAVWLHSLWPMAIAAMLVWMLIARTAWRVRTRVEPPLDRWLYGIHSHLQQIPIFLGQLSYVRSVRSGRKQPLIEYNRPAEEMSRR